MTKDDHIIGIGTLRLICALLIFMSHTNHFKYGFLVADFFFTLSGFLLTYLALNEEQATGKINKANFMTRRILRIWPLYFLLISFCFFILPFIAAQFDRTVTLPENPWYYWLFVSNYYDHRHLFTLKQLWSISVQEQFYIIFILLSFLFKKYFWLIIIILCAISVCITNYNLIHPIDGLFANTFYHLFSFAVGMGVAWLVVHRWYPPWPVTLLAIPLFLALAVLRMKNPGHVIPLKVPYCLFSGSFLLLLCQWQHLLKRTGSALKLSEHFGEYSYGIYLYGGLTISVVPMLLPGMHSWTHFFIQLGISISLAALSYHFFEKKFLTLKKRFKR